MSQNEGQRSKQKIRFVLLYVFSIVLLSIIFTGIWNMFETSPSKIDTSKQESTIIPYDFLEEQNKVLYTLQNTIQQQDAAYFKLHADSANGKKLDSVNSLINLSEISLQNIIDSIRTTKTGLSGDEEKKSDSLVSDFNIMLANHKSFDLLRNIVSKENQNLSDSGKALYALQTQLNLKNEKIIALENQVKIKLKDLPATNNSQPDVKQQVTLLQSNIEKLKTDNASLETQNGFLSRNNNQLSAQVNELKNNTSAPKKTEQIKNENLSNKIDDLNAQLILAQVDCNLSKADARQIISNSKQRKDLLQGSLALLNNLSHSDNISVQKRVKEKLNQLQNIAATVRD